MSNCYLCRKNNESDVQTFHEFVVNKAHVLTIPEMSKQFVEQYPNVTTVEEVQEHLKTHFLHPAVHVANSLRNLISLSDNIMHVSVSRDTDQDGILVDSRSVQLYIKLVNETMSIYRNTDLKKLLYHTT